MVELGSLWAAPLCAALLRLAGATVVKVESTKRPDGARRGPATFFDLLNAGKRSLSLEVRTASGFDILRRLAIEVRGAAANNWSDIAEDFFPDPPRTNLFFPEPGCSAPTFTGRQASEVSTGSRE